MIPRRFSSTSSILLSSVLTLVACDSEPGPTMTPDAAMNLPDTATPPACPEPITGPTEHRGDVEGNAVWTADASPHRIVGWVNVRNGAELVIEPCAVVEIAEGVGIQVAYPQTPNTGRLVAEGTAERPIRFQGLTDARWAHVRVQAPGEASFAHVTFSGGGGDPTQRGATIVLLGLGTTPTFRGLAVENVTIEDSVGPGVSLLRTSGFAEGSTGLTITGSGSEETPYPIVAGEHALGTLPTGTYTGNAVDEILVVNDGANNRVGLQESATLRHLGVPYRIGESDLESLRIGAGNGHHELAVLTIEAGVTLRFTPGTSFRIEHYTGSFPASGAVRAIGTASAPITFTSAAENPAAGDWAGLWYGGEIREENALDRVRIEYAGGDCNCTMDSCSAITEHDAAVILTSQPPSAFIENTTIASSAGHAFLRGYTGAVVDFLPSNTLEEVAGCMQTLPDLPGGCPSPRPACE